ncbi:MAG TPA: hypothetical protein VFY88_07500, partial [Intrasporangium sp.]|nr:hypothetical protein [Intrasporangium sp.]
MSLGERLKRRARGGAAAVARRLPTEQGPAAVRALGARARLADAELALRGGHDPVRALTAAESLTSVPG